MIFGKRAFFGYAQAPDGQVWWFANLPRRDEPAPGELDQIPDTEWRHRLLDLFADDAGPAVALIDATDAMMPMSPIHALPASAHLAKRAAWWSSVTPRTPRRRPLGRARRYRSKTRSVLARCLRDLSTIPEAFAQFEASRRPRVERIIKWAARMNNSKAAGPLGRVIRDALMPMFMKMAADSKANNGSTTITSTGTPTSAPPPEAGLPGAGHLAGRVEPPPIPATPPDETSSINHGHHGDVSSKPQSTHDPSGRPLTAHLGRFCHADSGRSPSRSRCGAAGLASVLAGVACRSTGIEGWAGAPLVEPREISARRVEK